MLELPRRDFQQGLALAGSVIDARSSVPVLTSCRLSANGSLRIEASDLDTTAMVEMDYAGSGFEGICLEQPTRVRGAINAAGGDTVRIDEAPNERLSIESGRLQASIATLPGDEHPGCAIIAEAQFSVDLSAAVLRQMERISRAICTEETRYYLNGMVVHKLDDWTWRFAATDGHRLMQLDVKLPGAIGEIPDGTIIPRRFLQIAFARMRRSQEPVTLAYGPAIFSNTPDSDLAPAPTGHPRISLSTRLGKLQFTLASKLIDGHFPDYAQVVPLSWNYGLRLVKRDLAQAIQSLSSLASQKIRAVKLCAAEGGIELSLTTPDLGEGKYKLSGEHNLPADYEIGFNGQYLLDMLGALEGDEVEFGLDTSANPAVIRDPADTEFTSVLMPMRV